MTLIDSCIVIDIAENGARKAPAQATLASRLKKGRVYAPEVVFAEVCHGYDSLWDAKAIFDFLQITIVPLREPALFRALKLTRNFLKGTRKRYVVKFVPQNEYCRIST